jgi:hypothetical protein
MQFLFWLHESDYHIIKQSQYQSTLCLNTRFFNQHSKHVDTIYHILFLCEIFSYVFINIVFFSKSNKTNVWLKYFSVDYFGVGNRNNKLVLFILNKVLLKQKISKEWLNQGLNFVSILDFIFTVKSVLYSKDKTITIPDD